MPTPPRLYLIDGSSQMYRAYHAIRGLTGPDGKSTNAVYGFVTMLRKLINDHQPQYIAASFDLAGPTFRDPISPPTTRPTARRCRAISPSRSRWVHEACEALGVPILTSKRFEADDVIGTLATKAATAGFEVAIVTGDKDFFQLVHDGIKVYNPKDEGTWYDADGVQEKFGVPPEQVVDVLALMGDSIDNIKGVPGIGEKGARDLIATYGTLEALLAHAVRGLEQAVSRRAARPRGRRATEPRAGADPHRRAGGVRARTRCAIAGARSERVLRAVLAARIPIARHGVRADRADGRQGLHRSSTRWTACESLANELRRGRPRSACACCRTRRRRCAACDRRACRSRRAPARRATCHFAGGGGLGFDGGLDGRRGRSRLLDGAVLEDDVDREGRARPEVRRDCARAARRRRCAASRSTRCSQATCSTPHDRAHRLEDLALEHTGYKALPRRTSAAAAQRRSRSPQIPVEAALDYAGERADLALQLAAPLRALLEKESLETLYDSSSIR